MSPLLSDISSARLTCYKNCDIFGQFDLDLKSDLDKESTQKCDIFYCHCMVLLCTSHLVFFLFFPKESAQNCGLQLLREWLVVTSVQSPVTELFPKAKSQLVKSTKILLLIKNYSHLIRFIYLSMYEKSPAKLLVFPLLKIVEKS